MRVDTPRASASSFVVGREPELALFADCLDRLASGAVAQRLALHGEPGLGKTRLIDAFRSRCAAAGVGWIGATASEADRHVPYRVWRGLMAAVLAGLAARWHQTVLQTVAPRAEARVLHALVEQAGDAERRRELLPVLGDLLVTGLPETGYSASLSPEGRADALAELVAVLVGQSVGETGLVLAIDDAQWMDSGSWRLLERVCQRSRGLLVVLGLHTLTSASRRLLRDPTAINRVLSPLASPGIDRLLTEGLSGVPPSRELGDLVARETAGFPLHANELLRALLDRGLLAIRGGEARIADETAARELAGHGRARDLRALLSARIERLPTRERELLAAASVANGPFTRGWIATIKGVDEATVGESIAACVAAAVIEPVPGGSSFRFRHAYLREAVEATTDPALGRHLHAVAAQVAEASARAGADAVAARIALHWEMAGQPWKATGWLRRAGLEAMQRFAHAEAIAIFERALRLLDAGGQDIERADPAEVAVARVEALRRGGYSLLQLGDLPESKRWLCEALAKSGCPVPASAPRRVVATLGSALSIGLRSLAPRRSKAEATREDRDQAVALIRLSHVAYLLADGPLLAFASLRCLQVVGRASPGRESAIIDAALATGFGAIGWDRAARARVVQSIAVARGIGDPATMAQVLLFCALHEGNASDWPLAVGHALESYRIARRTGDGRRAAESALVLGLLRSRTGRLVAGRRWYARVCVLARGRGDAQCLSWGLLGLARDALARGDPGRALEIIGRLPTPAPDALSDLERDGVLAAARLATAQPGAAAQALTALRGFERTRPITFGVLGGALATLDTLVSLAVASSDGGTAARPAVKTARRALGVIGRFSRSVPVARPAWLIARGRLRLGLGQRRRALADFREALRLARSCSLPEEQRIAGALIESASGKAGG